MAFTWPIDRSNFPALPDPLPDEDAPEYQAVIVQRAAAQLAVTVLWALSGRQWGLTDQRVRPCRDDRHNWFDRRYRDGYSGVTSYLISWEGDRWVNWWCGCGGGSCRLSGPRAIHLPGPVHSITSVTIGTDVLDPSGYTVEENVLYRVGHQWPRQDLGRPLGEVNTWSVSYQRGLVPPEGVAELTGILAKEFLNAITADAKCRLPRTVTAASRNGVSYRVYDPAVIYANGKTGLPEVDIWLASVNPHHLIAAPSVI